MDFKQALTKYYRLSKPGILYANVLTAMAGYFYASAFAVDFVGFLALIIGIGLVIAGACAANNYLDRGLDAVMRRTQKRALVTGELSGRAALTYAVATTILGFVCLFVTQHWLVTVVIAVAYLDYVVLYGLAKRRSHHGTLVGSVSGSMSLVAGYTAVVPRIDATIVSLFLLMVCWQMAHSYGIALFRSRDYRAAGIPIISVVKGVARTKRETLVYMLAYVGLALLILVREYVGIMPGLVILVSGLLWLAQSLYFYADDGEVWGKRVFISSLFIIMILPVSLAFGRVLA